MAEKKAKNQVKVPTEKQVSLLEKLMVHELEDVQQKALAIVLSIWTVSYTHLTLPTKVEV